MTLTPFIILRLMHGGIRDEIVFCYSLVFIFITRPWPLANQGCSAYFEQTATGYNFNYSIFATRRPDRSSWRSTLFIETDGCSSSHPQPPAFFGLYLRVLMRESGTLLTTSLLRSAPMPSTYTLQQPNT